MSREIDTEEVPVKVPTTTPKPAPKPAPEQPGVDLENNTPTWTETPTSEGGIYDLLD